MEKKSVTEILQMHGKYVTPFRGTSMKPLLREGRDVVVIHAPTFPLPRFSVPLYVRADGTHVLHRVMGRDERGYILCGDNQIRFEHGVREDMICGVMVGFFRGEKYVPTTALGYRLYVKIWCSSMLLRKICLRVRGYLKNRGERP